MSEFDLTEEEEEKLIDSIANLVVNKGIEVPAIMFFEVARPVSFVASQLAIFALGPLQWLFDLRGAKYTALFMKNENVGKIVDRIEALSKAKS